MCTNALQDFPSADDCSVGGLPPPTPPARRRNQANVLSTVKEEGTPAMIKHWGDSTVVRAPLNGPRVPSPSLTLYRRPRTARLPTDPTPALSRTRPALRWLRLPRPGDFLQTLQTYKKLRLPCFDNLTAMPQGPDEAALSRRGGTLSGATGA